MTIRLDFSNMMATSVKGGIPAATFKRNAERFREAHAGVQKLIDNGTLGFFGLPTDRRLLDQTLNYAKEARRLYDDVVVLGIGGSALGPIALRTALRPYAWNSIAAEERHGYPRLHVLDNVDPETIAALLGRLNLARTLFVVTSKSGGTAETMSQFLIVRERLTKAAGQWAGQNTVFITDPAKGALRPLASRENIDALEIPANVGGRFSVLTPVGLLPAALIGIDVEAMLAGAEDMRARCETDVLSKNPAGCFAVLQWLADRKLKKNIQVLMPYSDPLRDIAAWFVQLWAESLGKIQPDGTSVGPTPLAALGATDQHSQVQLFMEGPKDKTVTFIAVKERSVDLPIPAAYSDVSELSYLGGHTLGELISVEQRATAGALAARGRPNMTIEVERVDPWHVGGLMMLFEIATAYGGELYGIDAFNQPGVELGKQFAYAQLGRADATAARTEWESLPKPDKRWSV